MSKIIIAFLLLIVVLTGVWAVSALEMGTLPTIVVIWLLIAAAIGAWVVSEYQDRRWLRLSMGTVALLMSFLVAFVFGTMEVFNANAWFGFATKTLIETTILELEEGNTIVVVKELKRLSSEYQPTYENRARYDKLVEDTVSRIRSAGTKKRDKQKNEPKDGTSLFFDSNPGNKGGGKGVRGRKRGQNYFRLPSWSQQRHPTP